MLTWHWFALAVLVFWAVGAYNRLVRLRAQVRIAFQGVDRTQSRLVQLAGELPPPPAGADWASQLSGLHGAATQVDAVLRVARRDMLSASAIAALHEAQATLQVWHDRLTQASGPHLSLGPWRDDWIEATRQASDAVALFNQASQAHNDAIRQFPAVLLARLFGFRPGGLL